MSNKKYLFCKILFTLPFKNIYLQSQCIYRRVSGVYRRILIIYRRISAVYRHFL